MGKVLNLNKEILEIEYKNCGSMQKMASKLNVSVDSIYKYMKEFHIEYSRYYKGIYSYNTEFFNLDTEESFYWAGFIAADGCVRKRKNQKSLKITLAIKDVNHLNKFKENIISNHPINTYVSLSKRGKPLANCEIVLCGEEIYKSLQRFNIVPRKTFVYELPEWLIQHKLLNHFLRGYFDGDGCISYLKLQKGRVIRQGNFSVIGTLKLLREFQKVLVDIGLSETKIIKRKNIYSLIYAGNNNIKIIFKYLYENHQVKLDRKYNRFINLLSS